jgi:hypothetical protein
VGFGTISGCQSSSRRKFCQQSPIRINEEVAEKVMASAGTITSYIGNSAASYSGTLNASYASATKVSPIQPAKTAQTTQAAQSTHSAAHADTVDLSQLSKLVGQIELQLQGVSSTEFNQILSSAASSVYAQAQQEGDSVQAAALESLAGRLQVAANSAGLSALPLLYVASLVSE